MKFNGPKVLLVLCVIAFLIGVIGFLTGLEDKSPAGSGGGALAGGALIALAIIYHANKISSRNNKEPNGK